MADEASWIINKAPSPSAFFTTACWLWSSTMCFFLCFSCYVKEVKEAFLTLFIVILLLTLLPCVYVFYLFFSFSSERKALRKQNLRENCDIHGLVRRNINLFGRMEMMDEVGCFICLHSSTYILHEKIVKMLLGSFQKSSSKLELEKRFCQGCKLTNWRHITLVTFALLSDSCVNWFKLQNFIKNKKKLILIIQSKNKLQNWHLKHQVA